MRDEGRAAGPSSALDRAVDVLRGPSLHPDLGGDGTPDRGFPLAQMLSHQVRAKVAARRGELAEGECLARLAVGLGERTDAVDSQAWTYADLGEVLALAGRLDEAAEALEIARARFQRKGNVVMAERTQDRLSALREEAPA
jgi:hypothetical protein